VECGHPWGGVGLRCSSHLHWLCFFPHTSLSYSFFLFTTHLLLPSCAATANNKLRKLSITYNKKAVYEIKSVKLPPLATVSPQVVLLCP